MRLSYGVPLGPEMVAFHLVMSLLDGKAEMPAVGEVMRVISSDCRLKCQVSGYISRCQGCLVAYRLTTLPLLAGLALVPPFAWLIEGVDDMLAVFNLPAMACVGFEREEGCKSKVRQRVK